MAFRTPLRTLTAAALAALTAAGAAGCHDTRAHARPVGATHGPPSEADGGASPSASEGGRTTPAAPRTRSAPVTPSPGSPSARGPAHRRTRDGGLPPVIGRIPVRDKVVFITVDDGWEQDADFVRLVQRRRIPLTLFLTNAAIRRNYGYFRQLERAGALIEDHTMTHAYLPGLSYARQKREICATAGIYAREFGARPTLFRAPYGATSRTTLRAARDCGIRAVFFWREVVTNGRIAYQAPGGLHPGDIVLVHFDPHMTAGFTRLLRTIRREGFTPAAVRDHLPAGYFSGG